MRPSELVVPPGRQGPGPLPAPALAALDLALVRRTAARLPGEHLAPGTGVGTELAQLRPYELGDDVRRLDAAASARTAEPHVRLDVPERSLTSWLVLDVSASMGFGTGLRLKSDVAEGAITVLARTGVRRGGRVALLTAGGPRPRGLPPRGGRGALVGIGKLLAEGVAPDGAGDPDGLTDPLRRLRTLARHPGLVAVVSDFRDHGRERPAAWARPLAALGRRHRLLAVEVRDRREAELPASGTLVLVDPETGREVEADTSAPALRRRFAAAEAERRDGVAAALRRAGARHVVLDTAGDWLRELGRALR